jgi:hypothetical protein
MLEMKIKTVILASAMAALTVSLGLAPQAEAGIVVTIDQVGSNVVATGNGTINLTDLTLAAGGEHDNAVLFANRPAIIIGAGVLPTGSIYDTLTGPSNFGAGGFFLASSSTGDHFGLFTTTDFVVPTGYVSGSLLSATATWDDTTLAALGITDGTYVWTWGTGVNADSFTVEVAAVPEPSTCAMMILGFTGIGAMAYRRKSKPVLMAA